MLPANSAATTTVRTAVTSITATIGVRDMSLPCIIALPKLSRSLTNGTCPAIHHVKSTRSISFTRKNLGPTTLLPRNGVGPEASFGGIIDILFKDGNTTKGNQLLADVNEGKDLGTVLSYSTGILNSASSGNIERAEHLLEEMKSKGLVASCEAYNALVKAHAKEREWIRVYQLVSEMSHCGLTRDLHLFNVVIRGFVNNLDMASAVRSFHEMIAQDVRPNSVTFNAIIEGFSRKGWSAETVDWFQKMEGMKVKPTISTYKLIMRLYANSGDVSTMLSWLGRMKAAGLEPDEQIYTILFAGYANSPNSVSEALTVWEDHLRVDHHDVPSNEAVTTFLRLCAKANKPERARREWNEMKGAGFIPSVANCNELIRLYLSQEMFSDAKMVLFTEMRRADAPSDLFDSHSLAPKATWKTYVILLDGLSRASRQNDVEDVKICMFAHDSGCVPEVIDELPHLFSAEER